MANVAPNTPPEDPHSGTSKLYELSLAGVRSEDLRAPNFDASQQLSTPEIAQARVSNATIVPSVLEDLKRTTAFQKSFSPDSLVLIGQGGMAVVFSAWDPKLDRHQAIKVLTSAPTPEATALFREEAKLIAALRHPNLNKIYSFEVTEAGRPYFVMDLVKDAATLGQAIDDYFKVAVKDPTKIRWRDRDNQLIRYFLETLQAVEHLHERAIIHHDLKPANILISVEKDVFVTDFGLSSYDSLQSSPLEASKSGPRASGTSLGFRGTPRYAAPEQLPGGGPITSRTDVYQLGLILRQLTLNQVPFENNAIGSPGELLERIQHAPDPVALYGDPLATNAALEPELVAIMHKALQRDPLRRYTTAGELKKELEAFLDGREVQAFSSVLSTPQRWAYRARVGALSSFRWVRDNPKVAAGIAAAGASLIGAGYVVIDRQNSLAEARIAAVENQNKLEILAADIERDRELAMRLLQDARLAERNGNIDAAVNLIQPELLQDLRAHTDDNDDLNTLVNTLEREHRARSMLVKMRDLEIGGYAAAISGTKPGTLGEFDTELLLKARECFLPKGLTTEGIEDFDRMMQSTHFSQEQRREIAGAIAQISLCVMVSEHGKLPWKSSLPVEIRKQLAEECDRIAQACAACRVEIDGNREHFAVPNSVTLAKFVIERTYLSNLQPPIFNNGYFPCDTSMSLLYALYEWRASSSSSEKFNILLDEADRTLATTPDAFFNNALYSHIILQAPDNNDPLMRYKHLHSALSSLITAYEKAQVSRVDNGDLAVQIFKLVRQVAQASQAVPQVSRPELHATVTRAGELISRNRAFVGMPDAEVALAMVELLQGVSSEKIAATGQSLRNDPDFESDARWITVVCDIFRNQPLNERDAESLLNEGLPERAPLIAAIIYTKLGRLEEAIQHLEQLVRTNSKWRVDVARMSLTHLKSLSDGYGERFRELTAASR